MSENIQVTFCIKPRVRTKFDIVFGSFLLGASVTLLAQAVEHGWLTAFWTWDTWYHIGLIALSAHIVLPALRRLQVELTVDTAETVEVFGGTSTVEVAGHIVANDGSVTPKNPAE
jgi:hypothetical protein